jgi:hypothetical protein
MRKWEGVKTSNKHILFLDMQLAMTPGGRSDLSRLLKVQNGSGAVQWVQKALSLGDKAALTSR